jgi:hypothetical protein
VDHAFFVDRAAHMSVSPNNLNKAIAQLRARSGGGGDDQLNESKVIPTAALSAALPSQWPVQTAV